MLGRESGVFNAFAVLGSDDEVDVKPVEKKAPAAAPAQQQRRPQSARPQAASGPAVPAASAEGYTETKGRSQGGRRPQGGAVISPQDGKPSHPRPISATGALGPRPRGPGQGRNRPPQTSESYRMNEAPEHGKRPFERRSATGRGREVGRQGDGKFNWGDDEQFAKNLTKAPGAAHEKVERLVHPPTPTAAAPEDPLAKEAAIVEGEAAATAATDEAGAAASAAAEEEEKDKTIDYATWKKQRDAQHAQFQLSGVKASGEIDPNQVLSRKMSDPEGEWVEDEDNTPSGSRVSKEKKKILGISDFLSGERVRYSFADRGEAPRGGRGGFRGGRGGSREGGERPPREGGEERPRGEGFRGGRGGEGFRGGRGGEGFRGGRGGARGGYQGGQRGGRQGGPNFNLAAEEFPTLGK